MTVLSKTGIITNNTVEALHVTQSIDAFTGVKAYDIYLSGSLDVTGSINFSGSTTFQGTVDMSQVSNVLQVTSSWAQNVTNSDQILLEYFDGSFLNTGGARINWTFIPGKTQLTAGSASVDMASYNPAYSLKVLGTDFHVTGITKRNTSIVPNVTSLVVEAGISPGMFEIREHATGLPGSSITSDPIMFLILMKK